MSLDEARLLARVWERSQWLYENGYRARILPEEDHGQDVTVPWRDSNGEARGPKAKEVRIEVTSLQGGVYNLLVPRPAIDHLQGMGGILLRSAGASEKQECSHRSGLGWNLFYLLTGGQENFNTLPVGSCNCPFWRIHAGRCWCKHYLGIPLLLARQQEEALRSALVLAGRVVDAVRSGNTAR